MKCTATCGSNSRRRRGSDWWVCKPAGPGASQGPSQPRAHACPCPFFTSPFMYSSVVHCHSDTFSSVLQTSSGGCLETRFMVSLTILFSQSQAMARLFPLSLCIQNQFSHTCLTWLLCTMWEMSALNFAGQTNGCTLGPWPSTQSQKLWHHKAANASPQAQDRHPFQLRVLLSLGC